MSPQPSQRRVLDLEARMRLYEFVKQSNAIEGIHGFVKPGVMEAHIRFLSYDSIGVGAMEEFVREVAARPLRRAPGQDVRVGAHFPPPGGPAIERELTSILIVANTGDWSPYDVHRAYEHLHPFLDGNGRSGRVLWAWQMRNEGHDPFALPFLHRWYYQSLDAARSDA
jgi:hypothetical protein